MTNKNKSGQLSPEEFGKKSIDEVLQKFGTDPEKGLNEKKNMIMAVSNLKENSLKKQRDHKRKRTNKI
jgi:hypothetical protein